MGGEKQRVLRERRMRFTHFSSKKKLVEETKEREHGALYAPAHAAMAETAKQHRLFFETVSTQWPSLENKP